MLRSHCILHRAVPWACRPLHLSRLALRSIAHQAEFHPEISRSVAEESKDIALMDKLLRAVRERSDPRYHNIMPIRTPALWAEALLLNTTPKHKVNATAGEERIKTAQIHDPLLPRKMVDSYSELILPFSSDPLLLERYTNASGGLRTGKLMEHLDSLAGSIAYKHVLGPGVETVGQIRERGFYIVTAAVDRLDMLAPLNPTRDLRLSGQVIYTGKSSMEVVVKMEHIGSNQLEETVLIGRFSMVCRDANTHLAHAVNPLVVSTTEERSLYAIGEEIKEKRRSTALRSLTRVPPTSKEAEELHTFFLTYGQDQSNVAASEDLKERVWMGDTKVEKTMLMFPQERNVHQKIFGGYLMRLAYELGFANASMFTRGPIRFISLDKIAFSRPVPIGSILRLTSHILYTTSSEEFPSIVHVGVKANVVDVETGSEQVTNDFRFTWCQERGKGLEKRKVVPKTYQEAMLWLEGKRALELGTEIRGHQAK